jgi:glycine cleavage system pyridoxal-binding protein P
MNFFGAILQYPGKYGLYDYANFIKANDNEIKVAAADILSLVKLTPPGEMELML